MTSSTAESQHCCRGDDQTTLSQRTVLPIAQVAEQQYAERDVELEGVQEQRQLQLQQPEHQRGNERHCAIDTNTDSRDPARVISLGRERPALPALPQNPPLAPAPGSPVMCEANTVSVGSVSAESQGHPTASRIATLNGCATMATTPTIQPLSAPGDPGSVDDGVTGTLRNGSEDANTTSATNVEVPSTPSNPRQPGAGSHQFPLQTYLTADAGQKSLANQQQQITNGTQPAAETSRCAAVGSMPESDQKEPATPYAQTAISSFDHHAFIMMALASLTATSTGMSPPPTVKPSQMTLPKQRADEELIDIGIGGSTLQAGAGLGAEMALQSFARIEFADSVFQMTTYAVIMGRDQRALEQARRDERRAEEHQRRVDEYASKELAAPSPICQDRSKFSKSYVSEEGGMLGPESDSEDGGRPIKRRKTSTTGSSQNGTDEPQAIIADRQYVSHTPGAAAVDLTSLRPSPWHVPFIAIHSPGPNIANKTKAISREHLKIAYNQEDGVFEAITLHKNGFFCEDVHYRSDKVILKCGDRLQIKDVDFRFIINGVEKGRTGAEDLQEEEASSQRAAHGGKEMSFDFEQVHSNGHIQDTSDELSELEHSPAELTDLGDDDNDDDEENDDEEEEEAAELHIERASELETNQTKEAPPNLSSPIVCTIPKKRGPGRPPKNGIMSKREQRLLKKQQQELAKKSLPPVPPSEPPVKRKVGRPRKHPLPKDAEGKPEKRKYKPRKLKNEDGTEVSDAERRTLKKEKKARPKSPPLELNIADYTEEQLQKPSKSYGILIYEALSTAPPEGLTLKQIYKRICLRYPHFYFRAETKGWESSVRHNLIGNEAFRKHVTTGLWQRMPGVELDAGKKRKAQSPDHGLVAHAYGPFSYPYNIGNFAPASGGVHRLPPEVRCPLPPPPPPPPSGYHDPGLLGLPSNPSQPGPAHVAASTKLNGKQTQHPVALSSALPAGPAFGAPSGASPVQATNVVPRPATHISSYPGQPAPTKATHPATGSVLKTENASVSTDPDIPVNNGVVAAAAGKISMIPATATLDQRTATPSDLHPIQSTRLTMTPTPPPPPPSTSQIATTPLRPLIDPRLLTAVVGLKNGLVENLKKARIPKVEAIVMSALNRVIGLKAHATENPKMENICIRGICQVIEGFAKNKNLAVATTPSTSSASRQLQTQQESSASAGSLSPPALPAAMLEPKVLSSLNGFKDVSIKALKERLGESKAEAVTLSAMDRVLGLTEVSIVPVAGDVNSYASNDPGNTGGASGGSSCAAMFEGVEQHLIKSIRQLLQGMNQKLPQYDAK